MGFLKKGLGAVGGVLKDAVSEGGKTFVEATTGGLVKLGDDVNANVKVVAENVALFAEHIADMPEDIEALKKDNRRLRKLVKRIEANQGEMICMLKALHEQRKTE